MKRLFFKNNTPPELVSGVRFKSEATYELVERLGRGGMGEVWRARRFSAGGHVQPVAVKFVRDAVESGGGLNEEALRMSHLVHDNIVPFLDSGVDGAGRTFVAMALIDGFDLDELYRLAYGDGPVGDKLPTTRIPDHLVGFIMFMTLRALSYAHARDFDGVTGLIHRDISPGNILIDERGGFVKLSDFGVALLSSAGESGTSQISGKVPYMAPEVLLEEPISCQVDVYALGLVAYELLTGFNPNLLSRRVESVLGAISEVMLSLDNPLVPPHQVVANIDPALSNVVVGMLEKDLDKRYQCADEVMSELGQVLYGEGFGPTTSALADYIQLLKAPEQDPTAVQRARLRFLPASVAGDRYRPAYRLTQEARAALDKGLNPARRYDSA